MAFRTPPEMLLRMAIRKNGLNHVRTCLTSATRSSSYKAAVCTELGQPLEVKEMPSKEQLSKNEVRINVNYSSINFADILSSQGKYQEKKQTPFIPGAEMSGTVAEFGDSVKHLKIGDRVLAFTPAGTMTQECVVPATSVMPLPPDVDLAAAAATIVTYCTAYVGLKRKANLKEGETILVTAAAGGAGLAAVDLAKNVFKAKVIGAVGSDAKREVVKQFGAFETINYSTESVRSRVKEITKGKGVDVVYDIVGGKVTEECLYGLSFEGRLVVIGFASGTIPKLPANLLLLKSAFATGLYWGSYAQRDPAVFQDSIKSVAQLLAKGQIKPHVSKVFPLEQVNEAFNFVLERKSTGKVLLQLN